MPGAQAPSPATVAASAAVHTVNIPQALSSTHVTPEEPALAGDGACIPG